MCVALLSGRLVDVSLVVSSVEARSCAKGMKWSDLLRSDVPVKVELLPSTEIPLSQIGMSPFKRQKVLIESLI